PADVADEALRMAEFGLSNAQVLAAVSHDGFRATNRESAFGVGTVADAVLFEEDPLSVLGVLRHPAVVIRKGNMI
ncbi:MAG: amidohydrolase, partial [Acidimicrobiia bacterium]